MTPAIAHFAKLPLSGLRYFNPETTPIGKLFFLGPLGNDQFSDDPGAWESMEIADAINILALKDAIWPAHEANLSKFMVAD